MKCLTLTLRQSDARQGFMKKAALLIILAGSGCINIKAPDKPIEINLNVNIKQEVIVKLQKDVDALITSNPELFPK
jgi:YnbE-like lipoprotein